MDTVDPYAPPTTVASDHSVASGVARVTQVLLGVGIALHAYAVFNAWQGYGYYTDPLLSADVDADPTTTPFALGMYFVQLGLLIATYIVFGRWIVLSKRECRRLGATQLTFSPGWSVGWYFIPIANLWKPYQAMAEAFRASQSWEGPRSSWSRLPVPAIVPIWWAVWIASTFADQASTRLTMRAMSTDAWATASISDIVAGLISIALGAVAIGLVGSLTDLQAERRAALDEGRIQLAAAHAADYA